MRIEGRVKQPYSIDLAGLQTMPRTSHEVWLECAGNSRRRFDPPGEGNQWDDHAISNARFTGVSLADVLDRAQVEADANEVVATGYDIDGEGTHFQRGLPLEVARRPEVMLAYEMNGEPIPPANGGPVRLVVPRWAGIASVKWPMSIELVNAPFGGYYNAERYIFVDEQGQTLGTVREMPVKSIIAWPREGEGVPLGSHTVFGFAWSGHGGIERVEVSVDGQQSWSLARLIRSSDPLGWTRWEYTWTPASRGVTSLAVRATDSAGNSQPAVARWNRFGYQMNAILSREIKVE
jgi:DMSO/TMAO reductase YedYZ molybdopterin-dependent catalytic subunit